MFSSRTFSDLKKIKIKLTLLVVISHCEGSN